jgi:coproporphyrinogen III oxidase-like Fe-S oxidoreductase
VPYEAVGPGAHAFDGATRRWNAARLDAYIAALMPAHDSMPALPPGGSEVIDAPAAAFERAMLALRTADGSGDAAIADRLAPTMEAGLLERTPSGALALTLRGRLLSNEVFARLLPVR